MAQELDPSRLKCDAGHGRPVVGFAANTGGAPGPGPWYACCPKCLLDLASHDGFVYVRFRDDPAAPDDTSDDAAATADDDPVLKLRPRPADDNSPG